MPSLRSGRKYNSSKPSRPSSGVSKSKKTIDVSKVGKSATDEVLLDGASSSCTQSEAETSSYDDEQTRLSERPLDESFWPTLRRHALGTAGNERRVQGVCPICYESLSIAGLPSTPSPGSSPPRLCKILPCGHVLCRDCAQEVAQVSSKCPTCRLSLTCEACGVWSNIDSAPMECEGQEYLSQVPPTIPEGAFYESLCRRCSSRKTFLTDLVEGQWPEGTEDLEPGFVMFVYYMIEKMEEEGMTVRRQTVENAFRSIMDQDFQYLVDAREQRISETPQQGYWF